MAAHLYDRLVTDQEFRQRVRRHRPSSLLPLVAQVGAQHPTPAQWLASPYRKFVPWALAEIARVSLQFGNEYRAAAVEHDVLECCAAYTAMGDPEIGQRELEGGAARFFLRIASEQLSYQLDVYNELARTAALFDQTTPDRPLNVLGDPGWVRELLDCPLQEFVGVCFLVHVGAIQNNGRFSPDWIAGDQWQEFTAEVPEATVRAVLSDHLSTTEDTFRAEARRAAARNPAKGEFRRFSYNPLVGHPVIAGLAEDLLVPVPQLLVRKASPLGLYHAGMARWGPKFAQDVGTLFEAYVGRVLQQIPNSEVVPVLKYGKDKRDTVDWFLVLDGAVVLIEAKSVRPTELVRVGSMQAAQEITRMLRRSREQLRATADLIEQGHPDLASIPPGTAPDRAHRHDGAIPRGQLRPAC